MPRRPHPVLLLLAGLAACAGPAADASATTRYAAAHRTPKTAGMAPCTDPADRCTITTALAQAVAGDDVELSPGQYWKPTIGPILAGPPPFDDPVVVPAGVTLHGQSSTDLPVLHVRPNVQGDAGVDVRGALLDVAIAGTAPASNPISYSLSVTGTADRVRVETDGAAGAPNAPQVACALTSGSVLRNAVCLGRGAAGDGKVTAVAASANTASYSIRNVTGISTAPEGIGLQFGASNGTATASVSNSIFRGMATDVRVRAGQSGGNVTANVDHSNWVTQSVSAATGAAAVLNSAGGNQNAETAVEPQFVDAAAGDFRQAPGSPTIDAGVVDPGNNGPLALGGQARWIGRTTDLGADEFDPASLPAPTPTPMPTPTPAPTVTPTPVPPATSTPTTPGANVPLADRTAPRLSGLSLARSVKRSKGTTIRFTLSEAATVALAFGQPKQGRSVSGRCRAPTSKNRARPRCTIANLKGTITVAGKAGLNRVAFKGRLKSDRRLALGSYTLVATPADAAGNRGAGATRRFALKR